MDSAGTHNDLECVHGLRFFSMVWVIYGHTILYLEYQSFTHFYDVVETQIPSILLLPSLNANFSVDTFFVISGILTTYVTWEYTKGDPRKFNKFAFMISRYIRLTPQLAIVILCFFIMPLFGDGPMYKAVANEQAEVCYKNWLVNLLYLQSYVNADKHCIDPSWWLSIEMTFHVVSVLVIIVMINNPARGLWVNFIVAALFTFSGAIIHYTNGFAIQYLPSVPQRFEIRDEQTLLFFHRPYPHAASYFIGIALGYVLANRSIKKLTSSQVVQGWTVCGLGLLVSLYGAYYWNLGAPYTQLQATLYYNLCQILWPVSIAWIILACSLGHGGFVDSILSARCFVPLGRITYMTYLSHSLIIYFHSARMNLTVEPSMLFFTYLFIANAVLALVLGIILTVVYESPILNLQKQLFTFLTQKFDPSIRERQAHCLPTRLASQAGGGEGTDGGAIDLSPKQAILTAGGNTIVVDETAPLENGFMTRNGFMPNSLNNGYHHPQAEATSTSSANKSKSATAQCLLLNQNNEKQQ